MKKCGSSTAGRVIDRPKGKNSGVPSSLWAISGCTPSASATSSPGSTTEAQAASATAAVSFSRRRPRNASTAAADPASPMASAFTASAVMPPAPNSSDCSASTRL